MTETGWLRVPAAARSVGLTTHDLYELIDAGTLEAALDGRGRVVVSAPALAKLEP